MEFWLEGNPTTGYSWEVDACDDELTVTTVFEPQDNGATGAGGRYHITLSGVGEVQLAYRRPWDALSTCRYVTIVLPEL